MHIIIIYTLSLLKLKVLICKETGLKLHMKGVHNWNFFHLYNHRIMSVCVRVLYAVPPREAQLAIVHNYAGYKLRLVT